MFAWIADRLDFVWVIFLAKLNSETTNLNRMMTNMAILGRYPNEVNNKWAFFTK